MNDPVNHPPHYTTGKIECIDAIECAIEGREAREAFLVGQVIKYLWRLGKKDDAVQDCKKAIWYCSRLLKMLEEK